MNDFDRSIAIILRFEGGLSENANDPGGLTKFGISQRSHPGVNVRDLTVEEAKAIYRREYWLPLGCERHAWPFCLVLFDTGVQRGVAKAEQMAEAAAFKTETLLLDRMAYYATRVRTKPSQRTFLAGWINRVTDLWEIVREA